jgi:hypothetical protein
MTHPLTPPPELVQQWRSEPEYSDGHHKITMVTMSQDRLMEICRKSALYGADQELEACVQWTIDTPAYEMTPGALRAARGPKPPSLKEQALDELHISFDRCYLKKGSADIIRRALEALPE